MLSSRPLKIFPLPVASLIRIIIMIGFVRSELMVAAYATVHLQHSRYLGMLVNQLLGASRWTMNVLGCTDLRVEERHQLMHWFSRSCSQSFDRVFLEIREARDYDGLHLSILGGAAYTECNLSERGTLCHDHQLISRFDPQFNK